LGDQNATARAWGGALVLLGLVFFFFLLTTFTLFLKWVFSH